MTATRAELAAGAIVVAGFVACAWALWPPRRKKRNPHKRPNDAYSPFPIPEDDDQEDDDDRRRNPSSGQLGWSELLDDPRQLRLELAPKPVELPPKKPPTLRTRMKREHRDQSALVAKKSDRRLATAIRKEAQQIAKRARAMASKIGDIHQRTIAIDVARRQLGELKALADAVELGESFENRKALLERATWGEDLSDTVRRSIGADTGAFRYPPPRHAPKKGDRLKVALVSCGDKKFPGTHRARDLYRGDLFKKALEHAERSADVVFVISALHGLMPLDQPIACYDFSIKEMNAGEREAWGQRIARELLRRFKGQAWELEILAGKDYADPIKSGLYYASGQAWEKAKRPPAIPVREPLKGLQIGQRLAWLKRNPSRKKSAAAMKRELAAFARKDRRRRLAEQVRERRELAKAGRAGCRVEKDRKKLQAAELRAQRRELTDACRAASSQGREAVAKARADLARFRQDERDRIDAERRGRVVVRRTAAEARAESDDEVSQNIPPELESVWRRVRRSIQAGPRMSRTEAFLHWVEEHPDEVIGIQSEGIDDEIARMVAEHYAEAS